MNFPDSPSGGDLFNGFIYNATLGVWDVATSDGYFAVTNSASSAYVFNGFGTDSDSNPTLYLHRGKTYEFAVNATGHPFYIKTVSGTGTSNAYSDGVTNNGTASGTIKFIVPQDAPSKLYYNCSAHSSMAGEIIIPRAAQIDDLSDVDTSTAAPTDGQVLTWDNSASKWGPATASGGGGIALTDLSVTTNAAGTAALTYTNSTGVFSYTPPDLSSYLTSYTVTQSDVTTHQAALSITESQISDLGSYLTSVALDDVSDVTITSASNGQVLKYNGTGWVNAADAGGIALTDLSVTTNSAGTAALSYNNSTGAFSYTPPDLSSYLTSYTVTQSDVTTHQAALSITESQISDLGTYLTDISGQSIEDLSDVNTMTPTDGQVLTWDNANSRWDAVSPSGGSYNDASVDTHLNTSTASASEVLSWTGSDYDWVAQSGGGGGASVTTADTAPSSPSDGDLWYDTTTLRLYVYYNDGSSSQWVKANPSGSGSGASVAVQEAAPSNPSSGDLWWDTADLIMAVYYSDGDSSQWVQIG